MQPEPHHVALIPARIGSKRIPKKNLRPFLGIPMIQRAIRTAQDASFFEAVHVSTDSLQLQELSQGLGAKVPDLRPAHLCDDSVALAPVIQHEALQLQHQYPKNTFIWVLMPCTPLLLPGDLQAARGTVEHLASGTAVLSAVQAYAPMEWALRADQNGLLRPIDLAGVASQSNGLTRCYFDAGAFVAYSLDEAAQLISVPICRFKPHLLPRWRCIDIDEEEDWEEAEDLYMATQFDTSRPAGG